MVEYLFNRYTFITFVSLISYTWYCIENGILTYYIYVYYKQPTNVTSKTINYGKEKIITYLWGEDYTDKF